MISLVQVPPTPDDDDAESCAIEGTPPLPFEAWVGAQLESHERQLEELRRGLRGLEYRLGFRPRGGIE